jgi:hypothetical protein
LEAFILYFVSGYRLESYRHPAFNRPTGRYWSVLKMKIVTNPG